MICESGSDFVLNIETVLSSVMFRAEVLVHIHHQYCPLTIDHATQAKDRLYRQIAVNPKKPGYGSHRGVDSDKKVSIGTCNGNWGQCAWRFSITFRWHA